MTDRSPTADAAWSLRRPLDRAGRPAHRRWPRRPMIEALEGRALLSTGGSPDFSYNRNDFGFDQTYQEQMESGRAPVAFRFPVVFENIVTGEAVQADGKALVVGYIQSSPVQTTKTPNIIGVARKTTDGLADTTFGTAGSVLLPGNSAQVAASQGVAVATQADGKILVLGNATPVTQGRPSEIEAFRLNADGSIDTTFGTGGSVLFTFNQGATALASSATTLAIQSDGKILIGGRAGTAGVAIARLNADGTADTTFGTAGQALVSIKDGAQTLADTQGVAGLVLQPDGKIVYDTTVTPASGTGTQIAAGRLKADGSADTTFGTAGQVIFVDSSTDIAGPLAIQSDGKVVVTGAYSSYDLATTISTTHFDVYRLTTAGVLDATFGVSGKATLFASTYAGNLGRFGGTQQDFANALAIQADGKILVGGTEREGIVSFYQSTPMIVRLDPDGTPDFRFGTAGRMIIPAAYLGLTYGDEPLTSVDGLAVQADGKILAAVGDGVIRLLPAGAPNDFDEDGKTDPAIYLPSLGVFAYRPSGGGPDVLLPFGQTGAGQTLPAPAAYNGFGITELGVFLPALGGFGIRPYNGGTTSDYINVGFNTAGIPAPADYFGSGATQIGIYLPPAGAFIYRPARAFDGQSNTIVMFGTPAHSIPVPADYDGAGRDEIAVYLPQLGAFAYRPASGAADVTLPFGTPGDGNAIPVPGDYDGSGKTELAVYLPQLGAFAYRPASAPDGSRDQIIPFGMPGAGMSLPMPGDYDGSGHLELGVYIPSLAEFIYRPAGGGPDVVEPYFGIPGNAGQTIPFTTTEGAMIAAGSGGNGHAIARSLPVTMLDFVPELAGQPKKKGEKVAGTTSAQG